MRPEQSGGTQPLESLSSASRPPSGAQPVQDILRGLITWIAGGNGPAAAVSEDDRHFDLQRHLANQLPSRVARHQVEVIHLRVPLPDPISAYQTILSLLGQPTGDGSLASALRLLRRYLKEVRQDKRKVLLLVNNAHRLDQSTLAALVENPLVADEERVWNVLLVGNQTLPDHLAEVRATQPIQFPARIFRLSPSGTMVAERLAARVAEREEKPDHDWFHGMDSPATDDETSAIELTVTAPEAPSLPSAPPAGSGGPDPTPPGPRSQRRLWLPLPGGRPRYASLGGATMLMLAAGFGSALWGTMPSGAATAPKEVAPAAPSGIYRDPMARTAPNPPPNLHGTFASEESTAPGVGFMTPPAESREVAARPADLQTAPTAIPVEARVLSSVTEAPVDLAVETESPPVANNQPIPQRHRAETTPPLVLAAPVNPSATSSPLTLFPGERRSPTVTKPSPVTGHLAKEILPTKLPSDAGVGREAGPTASRPAPVKARRTFQAALEDHPLLQHQWQQSTAWLEGTERGHYTIQLSSVPMDQESLAALVRWVHEENKQNRPLHILPIDQKRVGVYFGRFPDRASAQSELAVLNKSLGSERQSGGGSILPKTAYRLKKIQEIKPIHPG